MRILIFGDIPGIPQLLRHIPVEHLVGIVGAAIRPQYHTALATIAETHALPLLIQPKVDSADYANFRAVVTKLAPDLIWVNSYSMIIREDILSVPCLGGVNIHGALLPQYRGCNPTQWAMLNHESLTGVTLHEMTAGLDEGAVIAQKSVPLFFEDTWRVVQARISQATDELILEQLPALLAGRWHAVLQDKALARHHRRRKAEDGRFEWQQSLVDIYNLIRALVAPYPGAFYIDAAGEKQVIDVYTPLSILLAEKCERLGEGYMRAEQIRLRHVRLEDKSLLHDWISNRELFIFNAPFYTVSELDHERWLESLITKRTDLVFFVIEHLSDGRSIGSCQLMNINWVHRSAELQILIGDTAAHGQCVGSEAVGLLCEFGFYDLNLHRIYLNVFATNTRAIRVYEKYGFVKEGQFRQAAHIDGQWVDVTCMACLRSGE